MLLLFPLLIGCFHYTPSRREIEQSGDKSVAGAEAFNAYQAELKARLDSLLKERAPLLTTRADELYKIGAHDVLKVDVFGFPDLSGEMEVSEAGTISLPLLGAVHATGQTVGGLQEDLTQRFKRYVKNPILRLSVSNYNAFRVSVVGAVQRPGWFPIKRSGYLLSELLADAGGAKDNSGSKIIIIPNSAGQPTSMTSGRGVEIDFDDLVGTIDRPPLQIPLMAGDTVVVPDAGQFRVDGEVERPGTFSVGKKTSTLAGIASAGGFTYAANVHEVEVIRDIGDGKKASQTINLEKVAFQGAPDMKLRDGDIVIVPSAPGRFRARQLVEAFRSVFRGGVTSSIRYE